MMNFIDFHTHQVPADQDVVAVVDGRDTWGIHPWKADEKFVVPDLSGKLAIGECGLDGLRGPSMEVQEKVFLQQIALSEELGKPLIIHCVKAFDQILRLRKELKPKQSWMLHGFRGKPQQLRSLLDAGFFVGFGYQHNEES
ncbi:MAG: TatD family hydrolase, partial [Bacteroidaceae bacterium]|nr:TatD family hydrolase [Bacteroidaceae bacterium]